MFNPQIRHNPKLVWFRMVYLSPPYSTGVQFSHLCRISFLKTCKMSICVIEEGTKFTQGDSSPLQDPGSCVLLSLMPTPSACSSYSSSKSSSHFSMGKLKIQAWKIAMFLILSPVNSFLLLGYSNLT